MRALRQMEKKKKKNLKKKRKRKEKKVMAQHQNQLEEMLKLKLIEEQQRRGDDAHQIRSSLKKKLVEQLGAYAVAIDNRLQNLEMKMNDTKRSQSVSSRLICLCFARIPPTTSYLLSRRSATKMRSPTTHSSSRSLKTTWSSLDKD